MGFFLFATLENHTSGSFRGLPKEGLLMMKGLFYYFVISILTVGYGDIVAVIWPIHNATILVILLDCIYSLVFIARIVGSFSAQKNEQT